MNTLPISLTERAAQHIKTFLKNEQDGLGLRVAVKPTGCSGYQYIVETATKVQDHDEVYNIMGIKVVVDTQSLPYLAGSQMDFVREGLNSGFKFDNPNVEETCGCGESFNLKETQQ